MRLPLVLSLALVAALTYATAVQLHQTQPVAAAMHGTPSAGWTIHIDAQKHFPNHATEWAHHWCRPVSGSVSGMLECQIYASDDSNAALVATEVIVPPAAFKAMNAKERAYWHYHKNEIPKVNAKMPDVSASQAKAMVAKLIDTYGKVFVLWDPMDNKAPIGAPVVNNLEGNRQ